MQPHTSKLPANAISTELLVRGVLAGLFLLSERISPFERKIHPEESWLYKNPQTTSIVPVVLLFALAILVPSLIFILFNQQRPYRYRSDLCAALLGLSLSMLVTGCLTNLIKVIVGRPRPDFFFRCFPSGDGDFGSPCTGDPEVIVEGRKSFPSGHSSIIFSSFTFLSLYLMAKLQIFNSAVGRQETYRMLAACSPLIVALVIALSRTCDYHHHWQDVLVGSIIGISIAFMSYRQQYPSLSHEDAALPLSEYPVYDQTYGDEEMGRDERQSKFNIKWI